MPEPLSVQALACESCGALDPGPRELCAVCGSPELRARDVPGSGTLVSWTTIRRAPTRLRGQGPYVVAIVDLAAGVRLTGRLRGVEHPRIGASLAAVAQEDGAVIFEEQT